MIKKNLIIKNKQGLHARPAALFVQAACKFNSHIVVRKGRKKVNGKSIMGILMLAAEKGSRISIEADGKDEEMAIEELERIVSAEE